MRPIVKICGLTKAAEAAHCAQAGADWLGFIFHPQSPRWADPVAVADWSTGPAQRVGVFVNQTASEIARILDQAHLNLAQLHGPMALELAKELGPERVIKVFWPEKYEKQIDLARDLELWANQAAYFLFDAGQKGGGHGRCLNLEILTGLSPPRPWLLAGGLTHNLVGEIKCQDWVNFHGFDFNSGVEEKPGLKNNQLVRSAIRAVAQLRKE